MSLLMKPPPGSTQQDLDAERSVLGSVLQDPGVLEELELAPDDFYRATHRAIYQAMLALQRLRKPIDVVTVNDLLQGDGIQAAGDLVDMEAGVASPKNAGVYAAMVRGNATLRRLIHAAADAQQLAYDRAVPVEEAVRRAEAIMADVALGAGAGDVRPLWEEVPSVLQAMDRARAGEATGVTTGFRDLDTVTGRLQPGEFTVLAARPSMGKTSLALAIMLNAARARHPVVFFSLETPRAQLVRNLCAMDARCSVLRIRKGQLADDERHRVMDTCEELQRLPLRVDDEPGLAVGELAARARRAIRQHGVELVVVDYLQLLSARREKGSTRAEEVAEISRSLKELARRAEVHVLALAQLSRAVEHRSDRRPVLADLKESGAIEQDADLALLLWRPGYYDKDNEELEGVAHLEIAKNRNGPTGTRNLTFVRQYMRFEDAMAAWKPKGAK